MILCLKCGRAARRGSPFCGGCGSSLGHRRCPEGHVSAVNSRVCSQCGSRQLTRGTPSVNLRPILILGLCVLGFSIGPHILGSLGRTLDFVFRLWFGHLLELLVTFGFLSVLISWLFGPRGQSFIEKLWMACAHVLVGIVRAVLSLLFRLITRGR